MRQIFDDGNAENANPCLHGDLASLPSCVGRAPLPLLPFLARAVNSRPNNDHRRIHPEFLD